jgi:hypothetical protein
LSAAVIPHSDEHLKCQDPFQQLCTSNQALSSVTVISQPLRLGPYDFLPHCVWRQGNGHAHKQVMSFRTVLRVQDSGEGWGEGWRRGRRPHSAQLWDVQKRSLHGDL